MSDQSAPVAPSQPVTADANNAPEAQPADGAAPAPLTPAEVRMLKLQINGRDLELPEAEVIKRAQRSDAADEKFAAAAEQSKQVKAMLRQLQADPVSVLTDPRLGLNFRDIAERYLAGQLETELLPPEERERRELRSKVDEYERERADEQQRAAQQRRQALEAHHQQQLDQEMGQALAAAQLPKNSWTVRRTAELLWKAAEHGIDAKVVDVLPFLKRELEQSVIATLGGLEGDALVKAVSADPTILDKIRKFDVAQYQRQAQPVPQPTTGARAATKQDQAMTMKEWREELAALKK